METLSSTITSYEPLRTDNLLAPAPPEAIPPAPYAEIGVAEAIELPETACAPAGVRAGEPFDWFAAADNSPSVDTAGTAEPYVGRPGRPESLADLEAPRLDMAEPIIEDRTWRERRAYEARHSRSTAGREQRNRRILATAAATVALTATIGLGKIGGKPDVVQAALLPPAAAAAEPTGKKIVGHKKIMGVSPRQQKIIDSVPDLEKSERSTLKRYTEGIHKVTDKLDGVNPNVMLAQAVHESDFGDSGLASKDKNLFGMKGAYNGKSGTWKTWEEYNGKVVRIKAKFKKYPSETASMLDHINQMNRLPWYKDATTPPEGQPYYSDSKYLDLILNRDKTGGQRAYATDSNYKAKILKTINRLKINELTKIDQVPIYADATQQEAAAQSKLSKVARMRQFIAKYAWPGYRPKGSKGATTMQPAYEAAVKNAQDRNEYVGGNGMAGVDCGAFVMRVMRDSGADPTYNEKGGNTALQKQYLEQHDDVKPAAGEQVLYHKIKANEKLKPGDIAIRPATGNRPGHTFFYVGKDQPGLNAQGKPTDFKGILASASLRNRAPMASNDYDRSDYTWYRIIEDNAVKQQ